MHVPPATQPRGAAYLAARQPPHPASLAAHGTAAGLCMLLPAAPIVKVRSSHVVEYGKTYYHISRNIVEHVTWIENYQSSLTIFY